MNLTSTKFILICPQPRDKKAWLIIPRVSTAQARLKFLSKSKVDRAKMPKGHK